MFFLGIMKPNEIKISTFGNFQWECTKLYHCNCKLSNFHAWGSCYPSIPLHLLGKNGSVLFNCYLLCLFPDNVYLLDNEYQRYCLPWLGSASPLEGKNQGGKIKTGDSARSSFLLNESTIIHIELWKQTDHEPCYC